MKLYQIVVGLLLISNVSIASESQLSKKVKVINSRKKEVFSLFAAETRHYILTVKGSVLVSKNSQSALYQNDENTQYSGNFLVYPDEHQEGTVDYSKLEKERSFLQRTVLPLLAAQYPLHEAGIKVNSNTGVKNFLLRNRCQGYDDVMERVLPFVVRKSSNIEVLQEGVKSLNDLCENTLKIVKQDAENFQKDVEINGKQAQPLDLDNMPYCFQLSNPSLEK